MVCSCQSCQTLCSVKLTRVSYTNTNRAGIRMLFLPEDLEDIAAVSFAIPSSIMSLKHTRGQRSSRPQA